MNVLLEYKIRMMELAIREEKKLSDSSIFTAAVSAFVALNHFLDMIVHGIIYLIFTLLSLYTQFSKINLISY